MKYKFKEPKDYKNEYLRLAKLIDKDIKKCRKLLEQKEKIYKEINNELNALQNNITIVEYDIKKLQICECEAIKERLFAKQECDENCKYDSEM